MSDNKTKKLTNAQLQKRLNNAVIHLDKTRTTKSIYFSDKGLRLVVDDEEGYALIETGYHTHYFQNWTSAGVSRPFLYTKRFLELALENDCTYKDDNGEVFYSYQKLMNELKEKNNDDYNFAVYFDWWLLIIFNNLYSIAEDAASTWIVYFKYMSAIAMNSIILDEHKEDLTNKAFVEKYVSLIKEFTQDVTENVVFHKLTDEERMQAEISAVTEIESSRIIEENLKNSPKK